MVTKLQRTDTMDRIAELLGPNASELLNHTSETISKEHIQLPGPDFVDRVWSISDRSPAVLRSLQSLFNYGRLAGTGYVSILPVDQGIEHSAGASFAPNPQYFDPENIVKLAVEGGCNAVASTFGVLGTVARKYAHKIPFIVKINHNELLTLPNKFDQVLFGTVKEAHNLGAVAVGATIYFGSDESTRQITEISEAFAHAHELGRGVLGQTDDVVEQLAGARHDQRDHGELAKHDADATDRAARVRRIVLVQLRRAFGHGHAARVEADPRADSRSVARDQVVQRAEQQIDAGQAHHRRRDEAQRQRIQRLGDRARALVHAARRGVLHDQRVALAARLDAFG